MSSSSPPSPTTEYRLDHPSYVAVDVPRNSIANLRARYLLSGFVIVSVCRDLRESGPLNATPDSEYLPYSSATPTIYEMALETYSFSAELWEWTSKTSWFFLSVPDDHADDIEERFGRTAVGFGSIRVEVTIGSTIWRTSIFPSKESKTYVLPVKKSVRQAEGLVPGTVATVDISIVE
jgi:Domain of unknown function (DUF1905)